MGKALSYNNYVDAESALNIVLEYKDEIAAAVVKHTNPCGFATGKTLIEALSRAWDGDFERRDENKTVLENIYDIFNSGQ